METKAFSELFPLFNSASPETVEWVLSIAEEQEYLKNVTVIREDTWGQAVYLIISGWVKVSYLSGDTEVTMEILSRGDYFGEMAILQESPRFTEVITLSTVTLLSISAQRFIQTLFKDPQLHHRLLQLMVKRLSLFYLGFQLRHQTPGLRLAKILLSLSESYGQPTEKGIEVFNIPPQDLADVADIKLEEAHKILEKMQTKGWIEIDSLSQTLCIVNLKQLSHLARPT
jgi:CRP/FNR family cyclic AMP-dependent transcriptional regulator